MQALDLTDLYLEINKNKYPVLAADMVFSINALPTVRVIISAAENTKGGASNKLPSEAEKGALANLVLKVSRQGYDSTSIVLFCGYLLTETPNLAVNISSLQSTVSYQLVCDAGKLSGVPYGALEYYGMVGNSKVNINGTRYETLIGPISQGASAKWGALSNKFKESPGDALAEMIDTLREGFSKGKGTFPLLKNTLITASGPLSISIPKDSLLLLSFVNPAKQALRNAPVLGVYLGLLRQAYLGYLPQTVCDWNVPCKLIIRPFNAWSNEQLDSQSYITASDILGIQEQTINQLDQRIDYWVVRLPGDGDRIAVYGPNTGTRTGIARCLKADEFQNAIAALFANNKHRAAFAAAHIIGLPGWMLISDLRRSPINASKNSGTKTTTTAKLDYKTIEDVAKKIAITGFLTEGCSAVNIGLTVAPECYLKNLCRLGRMVGIKIPQLTAEGFGGKTRDYYGLLDSMGMRISVERKALHVSCSIHLSNVHNEEIHKQFKTSTPLYSNVNNLKGMTAALRVAQL